MTQGTEKRVAHGPYTHPEEWEDGVYMGNDGYTMHLDAGGFFDDYYEEQQSKKRTAEITESANALVAKAREFGLVLTIETVSDKPLAMGNYHEVVNVRSVRIMA